MDRADFHYELPKDLIAQAPLRERSASRLLLLDGRTGAIADRRFADLVAWLEAGDLVVLNDTRVVPARLRGAKSTGGSVELLLERPLGRRSARFQLRASRSPRQGAELVLDGGARARVEGRCGDLFELGFDCDLLPYLEANGTVPLPPYIEREPDAADAERYQTVFAAAAGAVPAPAAGPPFEEGLLAAF